MTSLRDGWLLATGTLTVLRVPPPTVVDRRVAGTAMTLAPLAVLPLALAGALACRSAGRSTCRHWPRRTSCCGSWHSAPGHSTGTASPTPRTG